ncbi:MAG: DUF4920 domain-containing protein [Flavobacteriaceae bacterium]|nr:DUF4920 domain-containing protein [Flavobacteriaceae bacterium]
MKKIILLMSIFMIMACKKEEKVNYKSFGAEITDVGFISKEAMSSKFQNLKAGDTLSIKFASKINSVCKKKGCWMILDLDEGKESMVRFKDYGFFMPLNADDREVIVSGKAYVTEMSVKELQHYAEDEGKSAEEIASITEPEFTYAFLADGVLMKD